jgi:hypothetical protein
MNWRAPGGFCTRLCAEEVIRVLSARNAQDPLNRPQSNQP